VISVVSTNLVAYNGTTIGTVADAGTRTFTVSSLAKVEAGEEVAVRVTRVDNPDIAKPSDFVLRTTNSSDQIIDEITNAEY
jgi:hypothetical protein